MKSFCPRIESKSFSTGFKNIKENQVKFKIVFRLIISSPKRLSCQTKPVDQSFADRLILNPKRLMYRSIPKPPMPSPPWANPRAFDFFEKFWSNSPLCCQFRRSNALPIRASKRVKSPTLQACEANCGNKFCKIFSHYEFLVRLVFTPHFKQRHIP